MINGGAVKVISFKMHGRYAHFCVPYTKVYRLTQPCPTKTAVMGFIGSVLGIEKEDLSLYQRVCCGVEICSEYRTISVPYLTRQGFSGSSANGESSRTSVEVIVGPEYRIYVAEVGGEILSELRGLMASRGSKYTPYLGLAQYIASTDFQVSEVIDGELKEGIDCEVSGVFIRGLHGELNFERINERTNGGLLRITEFEGIAEVGAVRDFRHAAFTVNLGSGSVPLRDVRSVLRVGGTDKYVPIF